MLQDHNSISLNWPLDLVHIFQQVSLVKGRKVLGHLTNFLPSNTHSNLQGPSSSKINLWCRLIKNVFPPKPHSMLPPAQDTKVIIAGTLNSEWREKKKGGKIEFWKIGRSALGPIVNPPIFFFIPNCNEYLFSSKFPTN